MHQKFLERAVFHVINQDLSLVFCLHSLAYFMCQQDPKIGGRGEKKPKKGGIGKSKFKTWLDPTDLESLVSTTCFCSNNILVLFPTNSKSNKDENQDFKNWSNFLLLGYCRDFWRYGKLLMGEQFEKFREWLYVNELRLLIGFNGTIFDRYFHIRLSLMKFHKLRIICFCLVFH